MARPTMALVIARLRRLTDAATDDVFNDVTFWTDDQLQDILDENSFPVLDLELTPSTMLVNGVADWRTQFFSKKTLKAYDYERNAQVVETSTGTPIDSDFFTLDWQRMTVTLTEDVTTNTDYSLRITLYDMWDAAARVWYEKAEQRASYISTKANAHKLEMQQERQHCKDQAIYYRSRRIRVFKRG
jgi:hypothetical protein